ncbi:thioredoxin domain-containing protein [Roseisolibacter sp. H3M3-2]|uniref:thioredoxin family protein n=1 Tax=Roseisolibacter sp. H3M3-2 TaxID=3031323 RepID=UPI0023DB2EB0|nr:thioredoxin domain-containing protein [Roseisolibacter sp. H3M3-2]MDF1506141.1 thioredoxin domain-containing protein [Roseisolibacter sp. H3M3-2]
MSTLSAVTDATFDDAVRTGVAAVEFTAAWCGPCRVMGPIVEAAARDYGDRLRVFQMDADANPATLVRLGVRGLPTTLVFRDGALAARVVGAVPAAPVRARLDALLDAARDPALTETAAGAATATARG